MKIISSYVLRKSKRSRKDSCKQQGKSRRESSAEKEVSVSSHKSGQARPEAAVGKEKSRREDDGDEQYGEQGLSFLKHKIKSCSRV